MSWKDELKKKYRALPVMMCEDDLYGTFIPFIESLLKRQREICAGKFMKPDFTADNAKNYMYQYNLEIWRKILNAPEPE